MDGMMTYMKKIKAAAYFNCVPPPWPKPQDVIQKVHQGVFAVAALGSGAYSPSAALKSARRPGR